MILKNKEHFITSAKSAKKISKNRYTWNRLQKYKLLSENTRDIILFIGVDGKILEANIAAIKSYGYTYDELCHMRIQDLNDKEQAVLTKHHNRLADKYGYAFETIHKRKDGSIFPVEVSSQDTTIEGQRVTLIIARDISERKQMQEQLEYIARHDYLTNIPNRFYFEEFINDIYTSICKNENTLLVLDLDNFKIINDSYGHLIGNKMLIGVVDCISKRLKENDFVARLGGDEFAIFLSDANISDALLIADKILNDLENEPYCFIENNNQINVTASIGITAIRNDTDVKKLFSYADEALYIAKNEGKNRIVILKDERDKNLVTNNNRILTLIQNALIQDKFQIYLQPIYKAGCGLLQHYEVLIRMSDENNNILLPSSFIPLAERYGLMPSIDKWVIKNTIKLLVKRKKLNVFINLSGGSICDETLLDWIEFILNHSDINPKQIGFEITESTAVKDLEKTKVWIHKLKAWGCHFALDDFGVGFSSFSYLDILPVDYLKIDGTFIRELDSDQTKLAIVKAMNMVAHELGKKTIAEFVENESIWRILQELGVDYGQGYYLGKPAPFEHISKNINE